MDSAEKAYLKDLSNKIIDTFLFPDGIPFYWNVTVLLPDVVQIGFNVLSFFTNNDPKENLVQTDRGRVKLLQNVAVKYLKPEDFEEKNPFKMPDELQLEDTLPLVQTVFSRNVWFKCQGAREYISELLASTLSIALNFGLKLGLFLGTREVNKLLSKVETQISDNIKSIPLLRRNPELQSIAFSLVGFIKYFLVNPTDEGNMLKERLGMTRVNKYVIFSMLDAVINVCEKEAVNTLTGKSATNVSEKQAVNTLVSKSEQPLSPPSPQVTYPINEGVNGIVEFGACALNSTKKAAPYVWDKVKAGISYAYNNAPDA